MMLYEQVEKREKEACGGITTVTGSCKFCGKVATLHCYYAMRKGDKR